MRTLELVLPQYQQSQTFCGRRVEPVIDTGLIWYIMHHCRERVVHGNHGLATGLTGHGEFRDRVQGYDDKDFRDLYQD